MKNSHVEGAPAPSAQLADAATLLQVTRSVLLYPLLRALLSDQISRFTFAGAVPHFFYPLEGDEILAAPAEVEKVVAAIGRAIGKPRLRAIPKRLPNRGSQETLMLSASAKQATLMELLALTANLSAGDLEALPPPIQLQLQQLESRDTAE
jgi:hypothetical protein